MGRGHGHVTHFLNFGTPSVTFERVTLLKKYHGITIVKSTMVFFQQGYVEARDRRTDGHRRSIYADLWNVLLYYVDS